MQFFGRPEWVNVQQAYQLQDAWFKTVAMDPTRMYDAVDQGEVDVIVAYSSDGRIPRYELEILTDTRAALRDFFEVDARYIALAALQSLVAEGTLEASILKGLPARLGIDADKPSPIGS